MDRKQKIKMLKMIEAGELMPEDLGKHKVVLYWNIAGSDPPKYRSDFGEIVTREELDIICSQNNDRNARREAAGLETDKVIIINYVRGNIDPNESKDEMPWDH